MKIMKIATILLLLLMALPVLPAAADVNIVIDVDGDVNLGLVTLGNGTLLSIDYNGRDLLAEIAAKIKTIEQLRTVIVSLAMRNDVADLEDELAQLESELQKLVDELNLVLNDLYYKLGVQAHVIGINPGNTTVALTLISGNATIADYLDDILIDLNATDQELVSIRLQFENIYAGMMVHDTVIMGTRNMVRETNTTLNAQIKGVIDSFNTALDDIWAADMELKSQIDLQGMDVEELRQKVSQVHQELMTERVNRNNLTIMFGLYSVMVLAAIIFVNRK